MPAPSLPGLDRLIARAQADPGVLAVLLFGSQARGEATPASDVDVCLVLAEAVASPRQRADRQLEYAGLGDLDVSVFQSLPYRVQVRVLEEGTVLHVRDEAALYEVAVRAVRAWEDFKPIHRMYLDEVARG